MKSEKAPLPDVVAWSDGACMLLDQKRLPGVESFLRCATYRDVVGAIRDLTVRGAPAIGVAGGYAVALAARAVLALPESERARAFEAALGEIESARPTAVNLAWAVRRLARLGVALDASGADRLLAEARAIHAEEIAGNQRIGELGAALFAELGVRGAVMTHCNAGTLATVGIGTALGVIRAGRSAGHVDHVFACETRPVLQGMRLTAWELHRSAIPFTVVCDNMAAWVMRTKDVKAIVVGADRIAANGDVANKIGTYALAVAARHHGIPFIVAAPRSTFDLEITDGSAIPIEERHPEEILGVLGGNRAPFDVPVLNPAFDVTPCELVTAIVCEKGIVRPVDGPHITRVL